MMNRIEIVPKDADYTMGVMTCALLVDGIRLAPQAMVDLRYLAKSAQTSGNHDIFTCSCGCAMCAGIDESIFVHHLPDAIEWHFNTIDCFGGGEDMSDAEYEQMNTPGIFRFDPAEYQQAIEQGLESGRAAMVKIRDIHTPSTRYPPVEIALLTTQIFSDRDHLKDRRCVAKDIAFRGSDGMWISAHGIPYEIQEMSFPDELSALYRDFEASGRFPQTADDVPAYELFLDKGRDFGKALRRYLGHQSSVKFWYRYGPVFKPSVWSVVEELR